MQKTSKDETDSQDVVLNTAPTHPVQCPRPEQHYPWSNSLAGWRFLEGPGRLPPSSTDGGKAGRWPLQGLRGSSREMVASSGTVPYPDLQEEGSSRVRGRYGTDAIRYSAVQSRPPRPDVRSASASHVPAIASSTLTDRAGRQHSRFDLRAALDWKTLSENVWAQGQTGPTPVPC
jgi:hypothetical protein